MLTPRCRKARGVFFGEYITEVPSKKAQDEQRASSRVQEQAMSRKKSLASVRLRWSLTAVLLCGLSLPTLAASTKAAQGGSGKPAKVSFVGAPSDESPAARDKRLKRECKGRPNAGVCLGRTR
jgi:hypothetical protein